MDRSDIRVRYVLGYRTFRVFCDSDFLLSRFRLGLWEKALDTYAKYFPATGRKHPLTQYDLVIEPVARNAAAPDLPGWVLEMEYVADHFTPSVMAKINDALMEDINGTLRAAGVSDVKIHFRAP